MLLTSIVPAWQKPWLGFALVFAVKVALFLAVALPVPADDAFFYDGPVVNWLLHHRYVNPALAMVFPISGREIFSAYPPLYQAVLLAWMSWCGTSALSAMALHLVLFGIYMLVLLAIFRRLGTPAWCVNLASPFLLVITFHDRPDSLAHVFGMLAVYSWMRSHPSFTIVPSARASGGWSWAMAAFSVLCLGTSLQIGATYGALLWLGMLAAALTGKAKLPIGPMLAMMLIPALLVALVIVRFPHFWAGFQEHARQTPSFTGLRLPQLTDLLKVGRTIPGVLGVAVVLFWSRAWRFCDADTQRFGIVCGAGTITVLSVVAVCLTFFTANAVGIASYLQPLIVGSFMAYSLSRTSERSSVQAQNYLFLALALLGSLRAIGMMTWGVACAADVGYSKAISQVARELNQLRSGQTALLSSAFLYEAARHPDIQWLYCDWPGPEHPHDLNPNLDALLALKPAKLILTQFDYFRRYEPQLAALKSRSEVVDVEVRQTARLRAPDSIRSLQRVVQHISWAPVIIDLKWRP